MFLSFALIVRCRNLFHELSVPGISPISFGGIVFRHRYYPTTYSRRTQKHRQKAATSSSQIRLDNLPPLRRRLLPKATGSRVLDRPSQRKIRSDNKVGTGGGEITLLAAANYPIWELSFDESTNTLILHSQEFRGNAEARKCRACQLGPGYASQATMHMAARFMARISKQHFSLNAIQPMAPRVSADFSFAVGWTKCSRSLLSHSQNLCQLPKSMQRPSP